MAWKKNRKLASQGFGDLQYLPKERCGWDCTLASLAYGVRRQVDRRPPDLNAWAARHGLPASARYEQVGPNALVLWHGTSKERAERIADHGLFHKRGLWTTLDPMVSHGYCRSRSERFGTEGAVVCLVLGRDEVVEGQDYDLEGNGSILRFHQGLPPDVVEYVLLHEETRFIGRQRTRRPAPWPGAKFKRRSGAWVPVQKTPVRYSDNASYASLEDFAAICLGRLLSELGEVVAVEVFSLLYAAITPWDALTHEDVLGLIEQMCVPVRRSGKWQTLRAATASQAAPRAGRRTPHTPVGHPHP